jgi:hypothetical protein
VTRRRLLAVAAVVLVSLAVLLALGYVADDPQQAFGLLLTLSLGVVVAGYGLVRRGAVRVIALVLAGFLFLGALEQLADSRLAERLVLAGTLWLGVCAARAAFLIHVPLPKALRPRRPVLFLNPRSGGGKAERFKLADEARKRGIEPVELRRDDDLATLANAAVDEGADGLAIAGGDGSQAIVAAIAAERGLPYACIPAGTRNHFALDLGVDRKDVVEPPSYARFSTPSPTSWGSRGARPTSAGPSPTVSRGARPACCSSLTTATALAACRARVPARGWTMAS